MAEKGERYKEGKDYIMVDKGGYKTRRFLTADEKKNGIKSPKPKANPKLNAAPAKAKAAPAKRKEIPAKPLTTPKVETMKGIAPSGGRGNGRVEMVRRAAERALDKVGKAAPKAAFKSEQTKRDTKRAKEPVAMKIYDKVYGKDKVKMK